MERRSRIRYDLEEAVQFVLNPGGSESELSDLDDDNSENDVEGMCLFTNRREVESICEELERGDGASSIDDKNEQVQQNKGKERAKKQSYRWRNRAPPPVDSTFMGAQFSLPPQNFDEITPFQFCKTFWDNDMTLKLVNETNLYSVQKSGTSIIVTKDEMEQFLGIQMMMGIVKMPRYQCYWDAETRYAPIADVMSRKRYEKIRRYLHANDNSHQTAEENKGNRLYKVQPILCALRENCLKIEQEENQSVDEQIIPAKTKYSGIRQYNPMKPHKWVFKNFVRAGQSGMIYDFFLYTGAQSADGRKCTAKDIVMKLCKHVKPFCNHKIFFDNWFCTIDLCIELKSRGILSCATIRQNRLAGCPLKSEAELKKEVRGSYSFQVDQNTGIVATRWYDNKCVQLISTFAGVEPSDKPVKRWDSSTKSYIDVQCPSVVIVYNSSMGGVDLVDMLIALYRTKIKTKRWYLILIFHAIDIAKVNAWLLYRRYCNQLGILEKKQMPLLTFVSKISDALIKAGKERSSKNPVGRPPKRKAVEIETPKRGRAPVTCLPSPESRYDHIGHLPEYKAKKNKCRLCKIGYSRVYCQKCGICLCFNSNKNCFASFHE